MLTDEDIEKCREKATASYKRHYYSTRGQQVTAADDPEMHLIWEVIAAYEAKLREQKPVAWFDKDMCILFEEDRESSKEILIKMGWKPVFLHPAPIPEVEAENARLRAALEQYKLLVAAFFHQYDCCIPHQGMMAEAIDELRMYDPEALKGQP